MRRIRFVLDVNRGRRPRTRAVIDALVDPVLRHLPDAVVAYVPDPRDLNVHYYHDYPSDVFIHHGISDKGWRNADAIGGFEHIFHSGPAWQRRYLQQGLPADRLHQVGYAKLDPLFDGTIVPQARTVLWAPTLRTEWKPAYRALARVIDRLGVVRSEHPRDVPGNVTLQALADAEVVIADAGSTLYEAWALGKPVVFPDFAVLNSAILKPGSFEADIYARGLGYHAASPADLPRAIAAAREGGVTSAERAFIDDVFPRELRGTSGHAHAEALQEIAARGVARWAA